MTFTINITSISHKNRKLFCHKHLIMFIDYFLITNISKLYESVSNNQIFLKSLASIKFLLKFQLANCFNDM